MSRKIRAEYAGAAHHVMARDNQKEVVFADDVDRTIWLRTQVEACRRRPNHVNSRLPGLTPDVIDRSRILHSRFARHAPNALTGLRVKTIFYNSRD
jgi:hypothetical protein